MVQLNHHNTGKKKMKWQNDCGNLPLVVFEDAWTVDLDRNSEDGIGTSDDDDDTEGGSNTATVAVLL